MSPQLGGSPPIKGKMESSDKINNSGDRTRYTNYPRCTSVVGRGEGGQAPPDPGCLQSVPVRLSTSDDHPTCSIGAHCTQPSGTDQKEVDTEGRERKRTRLVFRTLVFTRGNVTIQLDGYRVHCRGLLEECIRIPPYCSMSKSTSDFMDLESRNRTDTDVRHPVDTGSDGQQNPTPQVHHETPIPGPAEANLTDAEAEDNLTGGMNWDNVTTRRRRRARPSSESSEEAPHPPGSPGTPGTHHTPPSPNGGQPAPLTAGDGEEGAIASSSSDEESDTLKTSIPYQYTVCTKCDMGFVNAKDLVEHVKSHPELTLIFTCSKCTNYVNCAYNRATIHTGKCKGVRLARSPGTERALNFRCILCTAQFATKEGLGQHERHKHILLRNENRKKGRQAEIDRKREVRNAGKAVPGRSGVRWQDEEVRELRKLNREYFGDRRINIRIRDGLTEKGFLKTSQQVGDKRRALFLIKRASTDNEDSEQEDTAQTPPTGTTENKWDRVPEELEQALKETELGKQLLQVLELAVLDPTDEEVHRRSTELTELLIAEWGEPVKERNIGGCEKRKPTGNEAKRCAYKNMQQLFYKDQKKLASIILDGKEDGKCPIEPKEVYDVYSKRFGTQSKPVNLSKFPKPKDKLDPRLVHCPLTLKEVKRAITLTKANTASGPDRVKSKTIKQRDKEGVILCGLFNIWLHTAKIPHAVKENNSILLPKKDPKSLDIGNWRPLTIASILLRLYTKILAARLTKLTPLCPRQRGFIQAAGCAENLTLVRTLIEQGKREGGIAVAFLDLAKAFDTVSHVLVFEGIKRLGGDDHLVEIVKNLYQDTATSFTVEKGSTDEIAIKSGVKHGDPLSPVLFNIAMDPLFCLLESKGKSYKAGTTKLCSLAYADDTACLSDTREGLQHNIDLTGKFCKETGLKLNVKKCAAFVIKRWGKSFTVNDCEPLTVNGESMPWIEAGQSCKYLGGEVDNWKVHRDGMQTILQGWCQKVDKAPLKPRQKMTLLRTYIIPRIIAKLEVLTTVAKVTLGDLDCAVRYWVKRWLKMSTDTTNCLIHAGAGDGGLGIPSLSSEVLVRKINRLKACLTSSDHVIKTIAIESGLEQDIQTVLGKLGIQCDTSAGMEKLKRIGKRTRKQCAQTWQKQQSQGKGAECFRGSRYANSWLVGDSFLKESEYITALKLRSNTVPTREYCDRINKTGDALCRRCHRDPETLGHILGYCGSVKRQRIERHDQVCTKIKAKAQKQGFTVIWEPRIYLDNHKLYKPDLILVKDNVAHIVDPTVVWDGASANLSKAFREKITKYKPIMDKTLQLTNCQEAKIHPVVVGARGAWPRCNKSITDLLKLPTSWCRATANAVLCKSIHMLRDFMDQ